jgi:succinate-semialdehyde dehydrogenase/glutarate-semialdehyde dehydrogenase
MTLESINPTTGEPIATYAEMPPEEVEEILVHSHAAHRAWRDVPIEGRAARLRAAGQILHADKEKFGLLMAREMGKPLGQGIAEAEKCAWVCEYYADYAERFLTPEPMCWP